MSFQSDYAASGDQGMTVMDPASDRMFMNTTNGFSQWGIYQVGFASNGSINSASKIEGHDVKQYYSDWQTLSAHTSQSGTYVYSTYNPSLGGPTPSAVRVKVESNGAFVTQGPGLVGHISGY